MQWWSTSTAARPFFFVCNNRFPTNLAKDPEESFEVVQFNLPRNAQVPHVQQQSSCLLYEWTFLLPFQSGLSPQFGQFCLISHPSAKPQFKYLSFPFLFLQNTEQKGFYLYIRFLNTLWAFTVSFLCLPFRYWIFSVGLFVHSFVSYLLNSTVCQRKYQEQRWILHSFLTLKERQTQKYINSK